jgi:hypothetical protein
MLNIDPDSFGISTLRVTASYRQVTIPSSLSSQVQSNTEVSIIYPKNRFQLRKKFRSSDVPNADLHYLCVVIVQWRCKRWFSESVETGRVYS